MELDKLKSVARRAYIFDLTRNENSAEHSWHLALAILTLKEELNIKINIIKTLKMALIHDICEIGAGDISVYDPDRSKKVIEERNYMNLLSGTSLKFVPEIIDLWEEYEAQTTKESQWVKVVDRLLPFMMNINTEGKSWMEQGISKHQVLSVNKVVATVAPEIYDWMLGKIENAVKKKWLINA
ncbi:MAG: HD domain-containing protein [Pseudomonadales bacterium]|nr:HD domain-containing protein [Pseudomonadales bacterium]